MSDSELPSKDNVSENNTLATILVSKYFCIVYILYIFVVTYYLSTDSIKDFLMPLVIQEVTTRATMELFCLGLVGEGKNW